MDMINPAADPINTRILMKAVKLSATYIPAKLELLSAGALKTNSEVMAKDATASQHNSRVD